MPAPDRDIAALLATLEAEAEDEIARLDDEVRREAEAIEAAAHADAARLEREPVDADAPALAAEVARRLAAVRLEAAGVLREAQEACVQDALAALRARLAGVRDEPGYPELLRALLTEALAALPDAERVRADPRDAQLVGRLLGELGAALAVEPVLETWGGVELADAGTRVARNTLEERLANAEPELRVALARVGREAVERR